MQAHKPSLLDTFFNYCVRTTSDKAISAKAGQLSFRIQGGTAYFRRQKYKHNPNHLSVSENISKISRIKTIFRNRKAKNGKANQLLDVAPAVIYSFQAKKKKLHLNSSQTVTQRCYSRIKAQRQSNKIISHSVSVNLGYNSIKSHLPYSSLEKKLKLRPSSASLFEKGSVNVTRPIKTQQATNKKTVASQKSIVEQTPRAWQTYE